MQASADEERVSLALKGTTMEILYENKTRSARWSFFSGIPKILEFGLRPPPRGMWRWFGRQDRKLVTAHSVAGDSHLKVILGNLPSTSILAVLNLEKKHNNSLQSQDVNRITRASQN